MTSTECSDPRVAKSAAWWLRVMAVVYDPFLWLGEIAGMQRRRRALLAEARGRVLEIGAGTGLNVTHYPSDVDDLLLAEPERALHEIARVLRPDGELLFIEHVRAGSRFHAACQDVLRRPWRGFAGGCVCNRPTLDLLRDCGFTVTADDAVWRGMPAIVHPLKIGRATNG